MHCQCLLKILLTFIGIRTAFQSERAKCSIKLDLSVCYTVDEQAENTSQPLNHCQDVDVCQKEFNITYIQLEPYSMNIVSDLLKTCCGGCIKYNKVQTVKKISDASHEIRNSSHFLFPVLGRANTEKAYGYYFIPLIETRIVYYITHKPHDLIHQLIIACVNMWPLVVICLLMIIISGFCGWLMETWGNKEEFPRPFFNGWFEGFWWSFISMTTVGYGDKVPKSIPARLFSVMWIFTGITTFSLVTAMLSSEITKTNSPAPPKMVGSKVGAIRHRLYEAIIVAKNGGILVDIEEQNITEGVHKLINELINKRIDGFVLDRYALLLLYMYSEDKGIDNHIQFLKTSTRQTEMSYNRDAYSYGILVKNYDDFVFLSEFISDNRDVINTCNDLWINNRSSVMTFLSLKNQLFSTSGEIFWPSITVIGTIIAVIILYGLFFEFRRRGQMDRFISYG